MARHARRILALNDRIITSLQQPKAVVPVRLGAPNGYAAGLLPDCRGTFARPHPNVMPGVTGDLSKSLLGRQQTGAFDLPSPCRTIRPKRGAS